MSRKEKTLAVAVMMLMVLHGLLGIIHPPIPAWKMFIDCQRFVYSAVDCEGAPFDMRNFVPSRDFTTKTSLPPLIACWYLRQHPDKAPISMTIKEWRTDCIETIKAQITPKKIDGTRSTRRISQHGVAAE